MANFQGSSPSHFPQNPSILAYVRSARSLVFAVMLICAVIAARALVLQLDHAVSQRIDNEIRLHFEWLAPPPGGGPATPQK